MLKSCRQAEVSDANLYIQVEGIVVERLSKNDKIPTGEIEVKVSKLNVLNAAKLPPFTIEDDTDGGDELRMKYRYLDLRRNPVRESFSFVIRWRSKPVHISMVRILLK